MIFMMGWGVIECCGVGILAHGTYQYGVRIDGYFLKQETKFVTPSYVTLLLFIIQGFDVRKIRTILDRF
jgi:hypothetical protein